MQTKIFTLLFIYLCLTGCATVSKPSAPQNQNISWHSRVETLSNIQDWDLKALVGIRTSNDAGSISLNWQQHKQDYTLFLFGPLGASSFKLTGTPGKVTLENPRGKIFTATTAEQLLASQTGWNLPVSYLHYWIRGLPAPNLPTQKRFDAYQHLSELTQRGWQIRYLSYMATTRGDMPNKIFIKSPQLSVKIVISQWTF